MKLLCWDIVVADDVYLVDLDFLFLVDVDVNDELVRLGGVVALHDVYLGILESFVAEELLDDDFCLVHHIGSELVALYDANLFHHIVLLALFHAVDVDL